MARTKVWGFMSLGVLLVGAVALSGSVSSASTPSEPAVAGWPRQLGTVEADRSRAVVVSSSGDTYMTGYTGGTLSGNNSSGSRDGFVARYDKSGILKWVRQFGTTEADYPTGLALSGNSLYVTGYTNGTFEDNVNAGSDDGFLARFTTAGAPVWVEQFGTGDIDNATGVAVSGGSIYVTGYTTGTFDDQEYTGLYDGFLARFTSSGSRTWLEQFGTTSYDYPRGVAVSGSSIYVTGNTGGLFDETTGFGGSDGFLARFTSSGTRTWLEQFGSTELDISYAVTVSGSSIYVTGATYGVFEGHDSLGGIDGFVARFTTSGTRTWLEQFGTDSDDTATGVAVSGRSVYICGFTQGAFAGFTNVGDNDGFLIRYTTAGTAVWSRQFGTPVPDSPYGVAVRSGDSYGGGVIVVGETFGTAWGQVSRGGTDAFVAAFLK